LNEKFCSVQTATSKRAPELADNTQACMHNGISRGAINDTSGVYAEMCSHMHAIVQVTIKRHTNDDVAIVNITTIFLRTGIHFSANKSEQYHN